jgi:hypothetical protein
MVVVEGGYKGKKGKKNLKKNEKSETFNIDIAVIRMLGIVGVSPPIAPNDIDQKIEELTKKQKSFKKTE